MVQNPLNLVTSRKLEDKDMHWLDNATPFALFKALTACYNRIVMRQQTFAYRIRNGKSWVQEENRPNPNNNYSILIDYLKKRFDLSGKKIHIPNGIQFGLPTSEKMFVGNIPTGTIIYGNKLAVGIYWEDAWGARDLDLSAINLEGKVGWNSSYKQGINLFFSGDITSAPKGAVEYLYANKGLSYPTLVQNNVYSGKDDSEFKIIVGQGDDISRDYMMNPNNLIFETKCKAVQRQTILGIFLPTETGQKFVLLNFGAGQCHVSGNSKTSALYLTALIQQYMNPLTLNSLVSFLGAEVVEDSKGADFDLSLPTLEKDTIINIFTTTR
jgi:hypothetical protein